MLKWNSPALSLHGDEQDRWFSETSAPTGHATLTPKVYLSGSRQDTRPPNDDPVGWNAPRDWTHSHQEPREWRHLCLPSSAQHILQVHLCSGELEIIITQKYNPKLRFGMLLLQWHWGRIHHHLPVTFPEIRPSHFFKPFLPIIIEISSQSIALTMPCLHRQRRNFARKINVQKTVLLVRRSSKPCTITQI